MALNFEEPPINPGSEADFVAANKDRFLIQGEDFVRAQGLLLPFRLDLPASPDVVAKSASQPPGKKTPRTLGGAE